MTSTLKIYKNNILVNTLNAKDLEASKQLNAILLQDRLYETKSVILHYNEQGYKVVYVSFKTNNGYIYEYEFNGLDNLI